MTSDRAPSRATSRRDRARNRPGSFTYPEYAQVGLSEAKACETHDVATTVAHFDATVRAIIEGHTFGFRKLISDRESHRILGCHAVGERAVEIAQLAAIAIAAQMTVDQVARVAVSLPTYAEVLVQAAVSATLELGLPLAAEAERAGVTYAFA